MGYVVPLRVGIGPCFQLAGLDFLYAISARRARLYLVIHVELDFSSLGAYFAIGSVLFRCCDAIFADFMKSKASFLRFVPLQRIEAQKLRCSNVIKLRR